MRLMHCNLASSVLKSRLAGYLVNLPGGLAILWCYFIWYLTMGFLYFQPTLSLWLNSLGLSLVVGAALILATGPLNLNRFKAQFWQVVRLVLCPFCVSSFTALTAGHGFLLLLSPSSTKPLEKPKQQDVVIRSYLVEVPKTFDSLACLCALFHNQSVAISSDSGSHFSVSPTRS